MAVSDPAIDVPTPTGTLQGVAAFSWDGSAWQPTGRAGPAVATPTGVLQGVAPFSWSGSAWTPAGRAQPGVATPSGVLDGVAVYTWSGSAWVPAGGQPTPSTPSGALRGVAAFNWDGSVWQPAAQAGPSVATPSGVLAGVAMFNWSGSAWLPVSATAPAIDISLMGPTLDPSITFTRTSANATYFDVTGTMQTAPANTPRFDYDPVTHVMRGLLMEEQRINVLLNSATLGTQSVAVTAQLYTLSFYGTGTITLSGVSAAGPLVGTGAFPTRVTLSFTPTAGTLTLTVTGSVLNAQLEAGQFATSYIPTTAAAATRTVDSAIISPAPWITPAASTLAAEYMVTYSGLIAASAYAVVEIDDATFNNLISLRNANPANATSIAFVANAIVGTNTLGAWTVGAVTKVALAVNGTTFAAATSFNGGAAATLSFTNSPSILTRFVIGAGRGAAVDGWMRRVRYWPRVLSNAELQAATT